LDNKSEAVGIPKLEAPRSL